MDQIKQFLTVALRLWSRLSPRRKRTAQLALLASGLLIAGWGVLRATPKYTWLLSGRTFSARELTTLEAAFGKANLNEYVVEEGRVRVPQEERAVYIGALAEANALPIHFDLELKHELSRSSPFESPEQRRARLQMTEQRELALILRAMRGIEDATVHLDESAIGPFRRDRRMTAMVVVRPTSDQPLGMTMIRSIRHLVAASKVDLHPEDVTVTDLDSGMSFVGNKGDAALIRSDELALRRTSYQRECRQNVERLLSFIPGAQVAVNVELEYRACQSDAAEHGSATVLVPVAVGIAIGIPESYYHNAWRDRQRRLTRVERKQLTQAAMSELRNAQNQRVEELVRQALPAGATLAITAFEDQSTSLGSSAPLKQGWAARIGWQPVVLGLLSITVLGILGWNIAAEAAAGDASLQGAETDSDEVAELGPDSIHTDRTTSDLYGEYHQELTRIVRQDPDAAAAKLAEWIDKAA